MSFCWRCWFSTFCDRFQTIPNVIWFYKRFFSLFSCLVSPSLNFADFIKIEQKLKGLNAFLIQIF